EDVRDFVPPEIDAASGTAHALEAGDDALSLRPVLQEHAERALRLAVLRLDHLEALDVALVLEDLGDLDLQAPHRHLHARVARLRRVADPGQHVCDGICHVRLSYQELLVTPATSPSSAS